MNTERGFQVSVTARDNLAEKWIDVTVDSSRAPGPITLAVTATEARRLAQALETAVDWLVKRDAGYFETLR